VSVEERLEGNSIAAFDYFNGDWELNYPVGFRIELER
jgi:hypothetical protein